RHAAQRIKHAPPIPPKEVATGPVMQNIMRDNEVDLLKFPVLHSHRGDGGRYIGTGDCFINRDPETGYVNMGTYRMQVHERNLLGIWQSPGQQGRLIAERYWKQGKACPVVVTFGGDPLLFFLSYTKFPFGISELDRAGGMLGRPVEVIMGPQWPGAPHHSVRFEGGILWEQLEAVGVPGIVGTYVHNPFLVVVAIRQQYAGHAKQAGMAVLGSAASARNGRFVVIVDEDIDPSNMKEVIWAMTTRVDPKSDIEVVENCWATPLDPRMPPDVTANGPH